MKILIALLLASGCALAQPAPPSQGIGHYGVIGRATVNVNAVGDTFIPVTDAAAFFTVGFNNNGPVNSSDFWIGACSGLMTTFQAALWSGPGATGTQLTQTSTFPAADVATLSARTSYAGSGNYLIWTHAAQPGFYLNVTVPQGTPGTCRVWLLGTLLP